MLDNPGAARRMAERGAAHAARFTTERTMRAVYDLVKQRDPAAPQPDESTASLVPAGSES